MQTKFIWEVDNNYKHDRELLYYVGDTILNGCLVVLFNPHIYVSRQGLDFDQGEARADMLQAAVTIIPFTILHYLFEIHLYNWITAS